MWKFKVRLTVKTREQSWSSQTDFSISQGRFFKMKARNTCSLMVVLWWVSSKTRLVTRSVGHMLQRKASSSAIQSFYSFTKHWLLCQQGDKELLHHVHSPFNCWHFQCIPNPSSNNSAVRSCWSAPLLISLCHIPVTRVQGHQWKWHVGALNSVNFGSWNKQTCNEWALVVPLLCAYTLVKKA